MENEKREYEGQTVPLAYLEMCMARADRRLRNVIIAATVIILFLIGLGTYERMQYDYVDSFDASCEGVYNLVDADGNVITSDLTADEVTEIMEGLQNGKSNGSESP